MGRSSIMQTSMWVKVTLYVVVTYRAVFSFRLPDVWFKTDLQLAKQRNTLFPHSLITFSKTYHLIKSTSIGKQRGAPWGLAKNAEKMDLLTIMSWIICRNNKLNKSQRFKGSLEIIVSSCGGNRHLLLGKENMDCCCSNKTDDHQQK